MIRSLRQLAGRQMLQRSRPPDIVQIGGTRSAGGGVAVYRFVLVEVLADSLRCHTWDGTTEGTTDIYVAKPWLLRKTPFDGETRAGFTYSDYSSDGSSRLSTGADESTEWQYITPSWAPDDEIYAIEADTGVDDCDLLDLNVDARCWGRDEPL